MTLPHQALHQVQCRSSKTTLLMTLISLIAVPAVCAENPTNTFDAVAPILIRHCLKCHQGDEPSGGLRMTTAETFAVGGESGEPTTNGDLDDSLLWEQVSTGEMPPESNLTDSELAILRNWIKAGSPWRDRKLHLFDMTTNERAGKDWWSLQPLKNPTVPEAFKSEHNPIDAFVKARLRVNGLEISPSADPITLVRRLSLHLHGIHPSPATELDSEAVEQNFEALVATFLASPRYGERWARHWLDLARFGESQGFERDKSRPDAWHYRDWVINALNQDMPYDRFAQLQIAGDCQQETGTEGIIATGFLVAGAYDEVGQSQQSAAMRAVVRQDELEDYVGTVSQTFLGLTTNCARCHDHKFDPILQSEYYALCAALDGVRPGKREVTDPSQIAQGQQLAADLKQQTANVAVQLAELERSILQDVKKTIVAAGKDLTPILQPIAHWDFELDLKDQLGNLHGKAHGKARLENGMLVLDGKDAHVLTTPLEQPLHEKTLVGKVRLENLNQGGGAVMALLGKSPNRFDAIVYGEREPGRWIAGSENFVRTQDVGGPPETGDGSNPQPVHIAITYGPDGTISLFRNGEPYGTPYQKPLPEYSVGTAKVAFGIRLLPVGGNRMLTGRIEEASLYDRALTGMQIRSLAKGGNFLTNEELARGTSAKRLVMREGLREDLQDLRSRNINIQKQFTYAVQPRKPEPTRRLIRGNTATPAEVVVPAGIASVQGVNPDFGLSADSPEKHRRQMLANWITSKHNPLFARVIVNRIWQHHFGVGLVRTPSDFGFTGGKPSHPDLLDYLANQLIESGWSLKTLHRLIVTSKTWKQAVTESLRGEQIDGNNRMLWRGNRTRLDAEAIRDSILQMAGQLNESGGGPSFQDFKTFNFNSQFYEVLDREGQQYNRRTVYRMIIRSGRHRLLDAFDCPDPSATAPKRSRTTTPLQSLSLMNHPFAIRMAGHYANRVRADAGPNPERQVQRAIELAWYRSPTPDEQKRLTDFVRDHDLSSLCRVLINSNEFLYVD
jgi:hypothetical protein